MSSESGAKLEPHLATFLVGARRELRAVIESGAVRDPVGVASLQRIERVLAYLAVAWREPDPNKNAMHLQAERLRTIARGENADAQVAASRDLFQQSSRLESEALAHYQAQVDALLETSSTVLPDADEALRKVPTAEQLTAYLRRRLPAAHNLIVQDVRQLRGVNSKDIIFIEIGGYPDWPRSVVMRRLRALSLNLKASMPYEFDLLSKLRSAGLLVPRPLLVDATGAEFGHPFLITERISGEARTVVELGDQARAIVTQLARHLARIHGLDAVGLEIGRNERPGASARQRLLPFLEEYYQKWTRYQVEPSPTIERTFAWLRANVSRVDETITLVHGDYDLRNVLVDGERITAILDWERSHVGHPAEDLAYCMQDVTRAMPWDEFLAIYRAAGGRPVSTAAIEYFQVWSAMARLTGSAEVKDSYLRGCHRDFVLGSAGVFQYPNFMSRVAALLAAVDPCT